MRILLDRIMATDSKSIISAYESRIQSLDQGRAALKEKLAADHSPVLDFNVAFEPAFEFLANPRKYGFPTVSNSRE